MEIIAATETLTQALKNVPSTQRSFDFDRAYYENRCRAMNETEGKAEDDFNCERCRNKGVVYVLSEDNEILARNCPDCFNVRTSLRLRQDPFMYRRTS